jgi:hypothetical protein
MLLNNILLIMKGWGNYKNYKKNKKVIGLAKKVEKQSKFIKNNSLNAKIL